MVYTLLQAKNHDRREDGKAYLIAKYGKISTPVKIATMKEGFFFCTNHIWRGMDS